MHCFSGGSASPEADFGVAGLLRLPVRFGEFDRFNAAVLRSGRRFRLTGILSGRIFLEKAPPHHEFAAMFSVVAVKVGRIQIGQYDRNLLLLRSRRCLLKFTIGLLRRLAWYGFP